MSSTEYPQLIVQESVDGEGVSCMLACDGKMVEAGGSILEAVDFLFKFIWVYLLKYNPGLSSFFHFLQFSVYKISYGKGKARERITGTVAELKKVLNL